MLRRLRKMSMKGDEVLQTWDTETTSPEKLKEIEKEFNEMTAKGYFAADITEGKNEIIRKFDPAADILLMPRMQGG